MPGLDPGIHQSLDEFFAMDCLVTGERKRRRPSDAYARQ